MANLEQHLSVYSQALNLRTQRHQVLASNIANADTPNYKARDFNFESAMQNALSGRARFTAAEAAHPRDARGFPMRWEAIYAQAWAPEPGTPMRDALGELAQVPLSRIPIRRRR